MASNDESLDLSLVPLTSDHTEVIRRHGSSVVLFDHQSQQVSLAHEDDVASNVCPTCQRPFGVERSDSFMSADYFNKLHRSNNQSEASSRSASPRRLTRAENDEYAVYDDIDSTGSGRGSTKRASSHISQDAFSEGYFDRQFVQLKELGRGGNGVVLLVRHHIEGNDLGIFAVKRIPVGDNREWLQKVLKEVILLVKLKHPNLVSYKHVWLEHFQPNAFTPRVPHAFILQQYCNRGDLQSYIFSSGTQIKTDALKPRSRWKLFDRQGPNGKGQVRKLQPDEVFSFFKDIASGLHHLHELGYIHRDLKPSNCLLDDSSGRLRCLVSDFGETTGEHVTRLSTGGTGTLAYCAPEVLRRDPVTGRLGDFTMKSDIFSLGLILYLMCFGRLPYSNANPFDETTEDIDKLQEEIATWAGVATEQHPSNLPTVLSESLGRLLSLNPDDRPNSLEVLQGLKNFGFRARGRSNAGAEHAQMFHTLEREPDATHGSSPMRRPGSSRGRSPSQYKAPAVESDETRSPPQSPTEEVEQHFPLPFPPPPETSLVRRQPSKEHLDVPSPLLAPSPTRPPLMLPAPRSKQSTIYSTSIVRSSLLTSAAKLLIFTFKLWTLLSPCQPQAIEPYVAYTLLLLAAIDLLGTHHNSRLSVSLAVAHMGGLAMVSRYDIMCQDSRRGMIQ